MCILLVLHSLLQLFPLGDVARGRGAMLFDNGIRVL